MTKTPNTMRTVINIIISIYRMPILFGASSRKAYHHGHRKRALKTRHGELTLTKQQKSGTYSQKKQMYNSNSIHSVLRKFPKKQHHEIALLIHDSLSDPTRLQECKYEPEILGFPHAADTIERYIPIINIYPPQPQQKSQPDYINKTDIIMGLVLSICIVLTTFALFAMLLNTQSLLAISAVGFAVSILIALWNWILSK